MFTDEQRRIFSYRVGAGEVRADPGRIHRALWGLSEGQLGDWLLKWSGEDRVQRYAAEEKLYEVACQAFDLKPFDPGTGEGALLDEALEVLEGFLRWLDAKKNSTGSTPPPAASSPACSPPPPTTTSISA